MNYFLNFLVLIIIALNFGCSSTTINKKENVTTGMKKYEAGEIDKAKLILQQACDDQSGAACFQLSEILTAKDDFKGSFDTLKKACDYGNLRSCSTLGIRYISLNQFTEARVALGKSNHINLSSEISLIVLYIIEKNIAEAKKLATTLCHNQYSIGCFYRARIAMSENDLATAKKFYALDSNSDYSNSLELGLIELQLGNTQIGAKLMNDSCEDFSYLACRIKNILSIQKINSKFEESYSKRCDLLDKDACYNLGLYYFLKRKKGISTKLFEKACKLGNGDGCLEKYNQNTLASLPISFSKDILREACDKNSASACYLTYYLPKGHEEDDPTPSMEKGCALGNVNACDKLAEMSSRKNDTKEALKKYGIACKLGFKNSCFQLQFLDKNEETQEAVAQKFCSEKVDIACEKMAIIYNNRDKKTLAQVYYEKSCDLKNQRSCSMSIELKSQADKNFKKFMPHYKLCHESYGYSCMLAGKFLEEGKQIEAAISLFERGCFLDDSASCEYLGWVYNNRNEGPKSQYFYKQSCDLGSSYSCKEI